MRLNLNVWMVALALPAAAGAQQNPSIAGLITDGSGAVLPGVTVEAASPALIEKTRSTVTDGTDSTASWTCGPASTRSR
jgi:hypothetical protein